MDIQSIKDLPDDILHSLDILAETDCQPGKYSLIELRKIAKNMDVLYLFEKGEPIYFLLLDLFNKHKMIYIHDVCVNKLHRGKSLFKSSLSFLKMYYHKKGFRKFTLDASDSTKEEGLNQKARIHIFHSAGFDINRETGYFTDSGDYILMNTKVLLDNGEIAEIQGKAGLEYTVKNMAGSTYIVKINQIEKCLDADSNPISCPMIIEVNGGRRKTRKIK